MHIKRFYELSESVAVHRNVKPERLPHCSEMESRGYRVASLKGDEKYAFHKDYEVDDDIYWLGKDIEEFKYGNKYIASQDIVDNKKDYPFYSIYCKCDTSPTDAQKKVIAERERENKKRQEKIQKEIRGEDKPRPKRKKKK